MDALMDAAAAAGAEVERVYLRKAKLRGCLACYECRADGRCHIKKDDFDAIYDKIDAADAIVFSSPVFFYAVTAQAKLLIDRCQSFWVRKYELKRPIEPKRPGVFVSVGATKGAKLFEPIQLTVRYFFDAIDVEQAGALLVRGMDEAGAVAKFPEHIEEARKLGAALAKGELGRK